MYRPLENKGIPYAEQQQREYWEEIDLLHKCLEQRKGKPNFIFYDGPPTANGKPGLHHVVARSLKDAVCRYRHLKGFHVRRKAGWDTHGLPVEIEVEKQLGLKNKKEIEAYGIEAFNQKCRESVFVYESFWRKQSEDMAYLIDLDDPYITLENDYIESVWWILKSFFDAGLMYEGHKILPFCTRCGTGLASHEVSLGYKDTKQETVTVAFKRKDKDEHFLVWTTTPWTLAANVLLTVNPESTYARVKQGDHVYIIAKNLIETVMGQDVEILDKFPGKDLEYVEYEPIMPFVNPSEKAYYVTLGDYVTLEDGTGIVHTAPAFGEDDYNLAKSYDAPVIQPVSEEGKYVATPWEGMFVMDADPKIVEWLRAEGKLYKKQRIEHNYPHCWRCETPLLYYASPSWYIEMTKLREELVQYNSEVNWYPAHIGEKRFGNWLENIKDWAISRNRYWGTPLPIWTCSCGHKEAIGSVEELKNRSNKPIESIELHRPYVDEIEFDCPHCQGSMKRVPYVIDVWFDSGAMPFAQMHYPFEHKDDFEEYFPADFICEGIDQTRGWFYSLLAISTFIAKTSPYKNVLVNDMLLDKDGKKMSKSRGNIIQAADLFQEYGADAVRWYLSYASPAWTPTKFDMAGLREVLSKFFGTLKNIYNLFSLYANNDEIDVRKLESPYSERSELDRWILSRLNELVEEVDGYYQAYDMTLVTRALQDFINEEFSNWYIRRSRRRYWREGMSSDKAAVYLTTWEVLKKILIMASPIAPFLTEEIYRKLTGEESVHLSDFPTVMKELIDPELNKRMKLAKDIVTLGRSARESVAIKVRQPLSKVLVDAQWKPELQNLEGVILEELNVKAIEYVEDPSLYMNFKIKPNFPVLGPKLGPKMGLFQKMLREIDVTEVALKLRRGEEVSLMLEGEAMLLSQEELDVQVESKGSYTVQTEKEIFVILETHLTEELIQEGYARELVSTLQQMRKNAGLEVTDRIHVSFHSTADFEKAIELHREYVMNEVLAVKLQVAEVAGEEFVLNQQKTTILLEKA